MCCSFQFTCCDGLIHWMQRFKRFHATAIFGKQTKVVHCTSYTSKYGQVYDVEYVRNFYAGTGIDQRYCAGLRSGWWKFKSRQGLGIFLFTTVSRPALGPIQPPIQCVPPALSLGVKRPRREADRSPPSSAEVKNAWNYISTAPIRLHLWWSVKVRGQLYSLAWKLNIRSLGKYKAKKCKGIFVPVLNQVLCHEDPLKEWRYSSTHFQLRGTRCSWVVSFTAVLTSRKEPRVRTGWTPEPVWRPFEHSSPCRESNPGRPPRSVVSILTELNFNRRNCLEIRL
jgi:hypothetical protein